MNTSIQNHHPTVKPLELCYRILQLFKTPNDQIIVDTFSGSGSILMAAVLHGYKYIGSELDPDYTEIANARIEYAIKNKLTLKQKYVKQVDKTNTKSKSTNSENNFF